jgi:DNA-directed RNA polymerase subunit RPC12/RpoP
MMWNCSSYGMEWETSIRDRVNGEAECPYCSRRKVIPGGTSFKALYPDLMKKYSPVNVCNPDELLPSYTLLMKWNCSACNMGWVTSIRDRVNGEAKCPYCSGRKAILGRTPPSKLYTQN